MHKELFQGKIQSENPNIVNRWDILIEFPWLQYILIKYKKSRIFLEKEANKISKPNSELNALLNMALQQIMCLLTNGLYRSNLFDIAIQPIKNSLMPEAAVLGFQHKMPFIGKKNKFCRNAFAA